MFFKPSVVLVLVDTLKRQFTKAPRLTTAGEGTSTIAINALRVSEAQLRELRQEAAAANDMMPAIDYSIDRSGHGVRLTITPRQ